MSASEFVTFLAKVLDDNIQQKSTMLRDPTVDITQSKLVAGHRTALAEVRNSLNDLFTSCVNDVKEAIDPYVFGNHVISKLSPLVKDCEQVLDTASYDTTNQRNQIIGRHQGLLGVIQSMGKVIEAFFGANQPAPESPGLAPGEWTRVDTTATEAVPTEVVPVEAVSTDGESA